MKLKEQYPECSVLLHEVTEVLKDAQEELRLLRMKDTNVVYDPTLRTRISIILEKVKEL